MLFPKPKRIKNKKLLDRIRHNGYNRCQICGDRPSETHHINTVGSSGDDVPENIVRLCMWKCHPAIGTGKISKAYLKDLALKRIREEGE